MEQKNERVNGNQKTNQPVLILFSAQPQIQAFVEHGLPWLGRKAVEMGRYGASEALRNKKLQRKAVNYGMSKLTPFIQDSVGSAMEQLSTKVRPKKKYKTD